MVCARELGVLTTEMNSTRNANASADILDKGKLSGELEMNDKIIIQYASDGVIAAATAKAIETCIQIHNNYR